jgi:hypothetical protein
MEFYPGAARLPDRISEGVCLRRVQKRGFVAVLKANNQGMLWIAVPVSE